MKKTILALALSTFLAGSAFPASQIEYGYVEGEYTSGNPVYFYHYADVDSSAPTSFRAFPAGPNDLQPSYDYYRINTNGTPSFYGSASDSDWYSDMATCIGGAMVISAPIEGSNMVGLVYPINGIEGFEAGQYRETQYRDIYLTFVIAGDEPLDIMFRGISGGFNAKLSLYGSSGLITSNTSWTSNNWITVENIHQQLGLPMLEDSSSDACILRSLGPGTYTICLQSEYGYGFGSLDMYVY